MHHRNPGGYAIPPVAPRTSGNCSPRFPFPVFGIRPPIKRVMGYQIFSQMRTHAGQITEQRRDIRSDPLLRFLLVVRIIIAKEIFRSKGNHRRNLPAFPAIASRGQQPIRLADDETIFNVKPSGKCIQIDYVIRDCPDFLLGGPPGSGLFGLLFFAIRYLQ